MGGAILRRLALVAFGLGASLIVAEVLLQGAALFVHGSRGDVESAGPNQTTRILCLGDSNTYGIYVPRKHAYPARLGDMITRNPELERVEILNAGVPGANSSKVLNQLPRLLEQTHPGLVLVMIGANNGWTLPAPPPEHEETSLEWLWSHSRVFRFGYMIRRAFLNSGDGGLSVQYAPDKPDGSKGTVVVGGEEIDLSQTTAGSLPDWPQQLIENLRTLVAQADAAGAKVVLLTYASEQSMYRPANEAIRQAARVTGAPLIDVAAAFRARCPRPPCPFLFAPDNHPTGPGYGLVARTVFDGLQAAHLLRKREASTSAAPPRVPAPMEHAAAIAE